MFASILRFPEAVQDKLNSNQNDIQKQRRVPDADAGVFGSTIGNRNDRGDAERRLCAQGQADGKDQHTENI